MKQLSRRDFVTRTAAAGIGTLAAIGTPLPYLNRTPGPNLFWTGNAIQGLRSVSDVRTAVKSGRSAELYATIRRLADEDSAKPPVTPSDPLPMRDKASIANNSPDFWVTDAAARRVLRSAFVTVVEDDPDRRSTALEQAETLFDPTIWEGWMDKSHAHFGHPAGLRTGMLAEAVGLGLDWLRPYLTDREVAFLVEGLERFAIQPFLTSRQQNAWWIKDLNNWLTTIVGGVGIAAMAMGSEHPESDELIEYATTRMEEYLTTYGPAGEFNESVHYANATVRPATYFLAHRYWSGGSSNRIAENPFPETCLWQVYLTLPPGRVAAFGDARPYATPWARHFAAVASATRDPILQDFYLNYSKDDGNPIELLWFDETIEAKSPAGILPKGRYFPAHGGCMVSRSDWGTETAACIVYGKSGREENHEHNDVGQVCIDANGERLLIDIGSPKPVYPADFFDEGRYEYYNASSMGHNVLTFDEEEQRYPVRERGEPIGTMAEEISGRILTAEFDDQLGAVWKADLTPAYRSVSNVTRTLIHLLPGFVAILDDATLEREVVARLRWHTIDACEPDERGRFILETEASRMAGSITSLIGESTFELGRHRYVEPFDRGRGDIPLDQRHEPFVEARAVGTRFRFLTLFAVSGLRQTSTHWQGSSQDQEWSFEDGTDVCVVRLTDDRLSMRSNARTLGVDL